MLRTSPRYIPTSNIPWTIIELVNFTFAKQDGRVNLWLSIHRNRTKRDQTWSFRLQCCICYKAFASLPTLLSLVPAPATRVFTIVFQKADRLNPAPDRVDVSLLPLAASQNTPLMATPKYSTGKRPPSAAVDMGATGSATKLARRSLLRKAAPVVHATIYSAPFSADPFTRPKPWRLKYRQPSAYSMSSFFLSSKERRSEKR
jgi:hypothetical protein